MHKQTLSGAFFLSFSRAAYNESRRDRGAKRIRNLMGVLADTTTVSANVLDCIVETLLPAMAARCLARNTPFHPQCRTTSSWLPPVVRHAVQVPVLPGVRLPLGRAGVVEVGGFEVGKLLGCGLARVDAVVTVGLGAGLRHIAPLGTGGYRVWHGVEREGSERLVGGGGRRAAEATECGGIKSD